jgi:hypothetical protein
MVPVNVHDLGVDTYATTCHKWLCSPAGTGLLYVGERGTWYPNFGLNPALFDLEFQYPANWTLVATGKQSAATAETPGMQASHWTSEGPIAVAGFNLGKYVRAEARAGNVLVAAYGTAGVERSFPKARPEMLQQHRLSAVGKVIGHGTGRPAASVTRPQCAGRRR